MLAPHHRRPQPAVPQAQPRDVLPGRRRRVPARRAVPGPQRTGPRVCGRRVAGRLGAADTVRRSAARQPRPRLVVAGARPADAAAPHQCADAVQRNAGAVTGGPCHQLHAGFSGRPRHSGQHQISAGAARAAPRPCSRVPPGPHSMLVLPWRLQGGHRRNETAALLQRRRRAAVRFPARRGAGRHPPPRRGMVDCRWRHRPCAVPCASVPHFRRCVVSARRSGTHNRRQRHRCLCHCFHCWRCWRCWRCLCRCRPRCVCGQRRRASHPGGVHVVRLWCRFGFIRGPGAGRCRPAGHGAAAVFHVVLRRNVPAAGLCGAGASHTRTPVVRHRPRRPARVFSRRCVVRPHSAVVGARASVFGVRQVHLGVRPVGRAHSVAATAGEVCPVSPRHVQRALRHHRANAAGRPAPVLGRAGGTEPVRGAATVHGGRPPAAVARLAGRPTAAVGARVVWSGGRHQQLRTDLHRRGTRHSPAPGQQRHRAPCHGHC